MNLDELGKVWFTSDHHFGHNNIIQYSKRPFTSAEEMDKALVESWNQPVGDNDTVFHLGDFTFKADARNYFAQLRGRICILELPWHHDKKWLEKERNQPPMLSKSKHPVVLLPPLFVVNSKHFGRQGFPLSITLSHYPLAEWEASFHGAWHLHGHSHGSYQPPKGTKCLDVGVDPSGYKPVSLEQIAELFNAKG